MTITVPWRRITLQLSQRALMEALTFNGSSAVGAACATRRCLLLESVRDATTREVVRREFDPNAVPRQNPDEVHPKLPGDVGQHTVAVFKFDGEHGVRKRFKNRSLDFDRVSLGHGRCSFPFSRRVPARRADTRTRSVSETAQFGQPPFRRWSGSPGRARSRRSYARNGPPGTHPSSPRSSGRAGREPPPSPA